MVGHWATVWVLLYLIVLGLILYWSLLISSLHAAAFVTIIYVSYYLVAYSGDGCREWKWLRSHRIWDRLCPYQVICINPDEFFQGEKCVLLDVCMVPGVTAASSSGKETMSLWAFALYGKRSPFVARLDLRVCLPKSVFYIPYLTDALQWAGCIADNDAAVAWETHSIAVSSPMHAAELKIPIRIALFRHDMAARCTLVGEPFSYVNAETSQGELERRAAVLNSVSLVNPYRDSDSISNDNDSLV